MVRNFDMVRRSPDEGNMGSSNYRKMSGPEIAAALERVGLTVWRFSRIIGAKYNGPEDSTVMRWIKGTQDAPTYLPALFALLKLPRGVETAEKAAERYVIEEEPRRDNT